MKEKKAKKNILIIVAVTTGFYFFGFLGSCVFYKGFSLSDFLTEDSFLFAIETMKPCDLDANPSGLECMLGLGASFEMNTGTVETGDRGLCAREPLNALCADVEVW